MHQWFGRRNIYSLPHALQSELLFCIIILLSWSSVHLWWTRCSCSVFVQEIMYLKWNKSLSAFLEVMRLIYLHLIRLKDKRPLQTTTTNDVNHTHTHTFRDDSDVIVFFWLERSELQIKCWMLFRFIYKLFMLNCLEKKNIQSLHS